MAKKNSSYICSQCNHEALRKIFTCPRCGGLNTIEEVVTASSSASTAGLKSSSAVKPSEKASTISELSAKPIVRTPTGIKELDRVLGGGLVDAEVVLFAGAPGSGKSTLSLAIADKLAKEDFTILYSSGEESKQQIALRAQRMGVKNDHIHIASETNLESLLGHIDEINPQLIIVDSLQTLASTEVTGSVGSVSQSKEAANTLTRLAKQRNIMMILINQIVKTGEFAGSEQVQHIVDCALFLESDKDSPLKFLRANKNRFGDTMEVGVFQHTDSGIEEVSDPSGILFNDDNNYYGTASSFVSEGVRQIPVEIQSLVSRSTLPTPRKQFNGVQHNRGQIVCAILDKFTNSRLYEKDVFVSTLSGMKINDPMSDLAIAAAILSSAKEAKKPERTMFIGELSLTGQIRGSFMIEQKLREAERLGYDAIVIPKQSKSHVSMKSSIKIYDISHIKELNKLV